MIEEKLFLQMMAERSLIWTKTRERVSALQAVVNSYLFSELSRDSKDTLVKMVQEGVSTQSTVWQVTSERMRAIYDILSAFKKPNDFRILALLKQMRQGALVDGVADKPWFKAVDKFLSGILKVRPSDEGTDVEEIRLPEV